MSIAFGILIPSFAFCLQWFCLKAKQKTVKLIPIFLEILLILAAVLCYFLFGNRHAVLLIDGTQLLGMVLLFASGLGALGIGAAFLVHIILKKRS